VRASKLKKFSTQAVGVDDVRELGKAFLPLAERLEQGIHDLGRRRRQLKEAVQDLWAKRDYRRVRESGELLIRPRWRKQGSGRAEAEHDPAFLPGGGNDDDNPGLDEQERSVGKVVRAADVARGKRQPWAGTEQPAKLGAIRRPYRRVEHASPSSARNYERGVDCGFRTDVSWLTLRESAASPPA
jgi:hypothetical protein